MSNLFIEPMQMKNIDFAAKAIQLNDAKKNGAVVNGQSGAQIFRGIFQEAVNNVTETERDLVDKQYLLATGQIEDAHSVMIAASEAQMAVDLLVSLRNKAMESYNELMRISL